MRFETISKRTQAFYDRERAAHRAGLDSLAVRVDYIFNQAIQNAEDTAAGNPEFTKKDYDQVALASLEVLLAGSQEADVQAWYRKQGFTW
jgi:hypothetical protein